MPNYDLATMAEKAILGTKPSVKGLAGRASVPAKKLGTRVGAMDATHSVDPLTPRTVAHLFRHLDDPIGLEQNPITRHLFEDPVSACLDATRGRSAVSQVHQLVLEALDIAKKSDLMRRRDRQAHRQYTIIRKLYLDGESVQEVARYLKISLRQLYRERAQICSRIAAHIWRHRLQAEAPLATSTFSPFEFEIERAYVTAGAGNASAAYSILNGLFHGSSSYLAKAEVACTIASVAVRFGDWETARENLALTGALLAQSKTEPDLPPARDLIAGRRSLVASALLRATGDARRAKLALDRAIATANFPNAVRPDWARFRVDVALERADALTVDAQFASASATLGSTSLRTAMRLVPMASRIQVQVVQVLLSLMLPVTSASSVMEKPDQLDTLYEALSHARSCGSPELTLRVMQAIAVYLAHVGMFGEATRAARALVSMASDFPNTRVRGQTLVDAAEILGGAGGFSVIFDVLNKAEPCLTEGNVDWLASRILRARNCNYAGAHDEAWQAALAAESCARCLGGHRFLGAVWREMALAAYAQGKAADAAERITAAVEELERGAPPLSLLSTYRAAETITSDPRWRERARTLERELAERTG